MPTGSTVDSIDAKILKTQTEDSRATVIALADMTSLSQNTVQARLSKLENQGVLHPFERRIDPVALGYPLTAFILTGVTQWKLTPIAESMDRIPKAMRCTDAAVSQTFSSTSSPATPTTSTALRDGSSTSTGSSRPPPHS